MCLDKLTKRKYKFEKENNNFVGWKLFVQSDSRHLSFECQGNSKRIHIGKWLNESDYRYNKNQSVIWIDGRQSYQTGFHIYLEKNHYTNRKVYFRNVVATGLDGGYKVIIAKEMFIVPLRGKRKCV